LVGRAQVVVYSSQQLMQQHQEKCCLPHGGLGANQATTQHKQATRFRVCFAIFVLLNNIPTIQQLQLITKIRKST